MIKNLKGYCPLCQKPYQWHQNDLDIWSKGIIINGECVYLDNSKPGYAWGLASRKPAKEYLTGEHIANEICGYTNIAFPNAPCTKPRGHEENEGCCIHEYRLGQ